jgi:hypothetical protein
LLLLIIDGLRFGTSNGGVVFDDTLCNPDRFLPQQNDQDSNVPSQARTGKVLLLNTPKLLCLTCLSPAIRQTP